MKRSQFGMTGEYVVLAWLGVLFVIYVCSRLVATGVWFGLVLFAPFGLIFLVFALANTAAWLGLMKEDDHG